MAVEPATGQTKRSIYGEMLGGSTYYSLPLIVQRLVSILLLPVYTRFLTPADYGVMDLLDQAVSVYSTIIGVNFSSALFYFFFQHDQEEWQKRTAGTVVIGSLLLGGGSAVLGVWLAAPVSRLVFGTAQYAVFFRIVFAALAASLPLEAVSCWLKAVNAARAFVLTTIVRLLATVGLTVLLLAGFGFRIGAVVSGNAIVTALTAVAAGAYCWVKVGRLQFDKELFWRIVRYSVPMGVTSLALFILHFGDRFVMERYVSLQQIGVYSLAYKIGMLVAFVHGAFHTYWSAQCYQILKRPDGLKVFNRSFTYVCAALLLVVIGITVFAQPMIRLLTVPGFYGAASLAPLVAVAYFIRALGDFLRVVFYVNGRPALDTALNWTAAGVCLCGYLILIPRYGALGAIAATAAAFFVLLILCAWQAHRYLPYRLEIGRLSKLAVSAACVAVVSVLWKPATIPGQLASGTVLTVLFVALLILVRVFHADEWRSLARLIRRAHA